jgi:hypothetical protein
MVREIHSGRRSIAGMFRKLLATALMSALVLASAGACTAKAVDGSSSPGAVGASSGNPPSAIATSPSVPQDFEIPVTTFKRATADQVVEAWTSKWHPRFRVIQNPAIHIHQAVFDNPFGQGTLELDVSQRGVGADPGAVAVGFVVRVPSVKGYLKVTPKALTALFQGCFSPILSQTQIRQLSSWMSLENANQESGVGHDFPGLRMNFLNISGEFSVTLLSR